MDEMKNEAAMQVLEEIKALLDSRLTGKLKPEAVEVTKVEMEPKEGMEEMGEKPEMGEGSEDEKDLEDLYSKIMG